MAQLKSSVVQGSLRVTDTTYTNELNLNSTLSSGIVNITRAGTIGWDGAATDITNNYLINRNSLAYWNGAYRDTSSNLTYVGTIKGGTWQGTAIAAAYIGDHSTDKLTSGILGIARGGTGLNDSPSMLTDLGSTTAADILTASPRPGITGTLDVGHGGTGAESFTKNSVIMSGNSTTAAFTTRAITNNTSATAVTASTNLITANTLYYHEGNSNIVTVGTITSGTWHGTAIAADYIGEHSTAKLTSGTLGVARGGTGNSTGTATYATTDEDKTSALYIVGVKSDATTDLKRDTLATLTGAVLTLGNASTAGKVTLHETSSNTGTLVSASLSANRTWTFPDAGGTIALTSSNITGTSANVTGTVAVGHGGTGATSAANARTNLGTPTGNARIFYGTCATAAGTTEKAVTCTAYDALQNGDIIYVTFSNTNSGAVDQLYLKVNDTDKKPIKYLGNATQANLPAADYIVADIPYRFVYNDTNWIMDLYYNTDNDYRTRQNVLANTDSSNRPLLLSNRVVGNANNNTAYVTYRNDKFYANVNTGTIYANGVAVLTGVYSATTAPSNPKTGQLWLKKKTTTTAST